MKKKLVALTLTAAMVAGVMTGCGNKAVQEDTTAAGTGGDTTEAGVQVNADAVQNLIDSTKDTVKLTVWASEEDQDFTQGVIKDFTAAYPDVKFDITLGAESEPW